MGTSVSAKQVEAFTRRKIESLISQAKVNSRPLAELRRGIGKTPGELPQLWGYLLESMPEEFYGDKEPSYAEWAVYTALTMFALHQQGKDAGTEPMQKDGQSIGSALSCLVHDSDDSERISRRFKTIATSGSVEELAHHMRGAVQLLRSEGIGLDYPKLAGDIYRFQFPDMVSGVRLSWGQDFYRRRSEEKQSIGGLKDEELIS
jgi:CRISPR system Cascade subunit CasB